MAVVQRGMAGGLMALWCRNLPIVSVPRGETPKRVTFVYPYYENKDFLCRQMHEWHSYPTVLRANVSAIVIDDGSPQPAALPRPSELWCVDWKHVDEWPFGIQLFRIEQDVRWNWLAARNIGAHHAEDGWLLLTDMDHVVPADTLRAVVYGQHDPSVVYAFSRREHTSEVIAPHSASFLMTRAMFWKIGGYDEALSGHYGTDGEFRRRVAKAAPMRVLTDELVRYEHQGDSSTMRYLRKQPEDAAVAKIVASRRPGWTPKTLSFPYHQVSA